MAKKSVKYNQHGLGKGKTMSRDVRDVTPVYVTRKLRVLRGSKLQGKPSNDVYIPDPNNLLI